MGKNFRKPLGGIFMTHTLRRIVSIISLREAARKMISYGHSRTCSISIARMRSYLRLHIVKSNPQFYCNIEETVMLSPRGQAVLEAKILSSASKICPWPRTRPRAFVIGLSSNFLCWPRVTSLGASLSVSRL